MPGMIEGTTYQVVGVRPDGSRELCGARLSRQTADSMASTLRTMRNYTDVLIEQESASTQPKSEQGTQSHHW